MASQEVGDLLEDCLEALARSQQSSQFTEEDKLHYCSCKGWSLDGAIESLLVQTQETSDRDVVGSFGGGIVLTQGLHKWIVLTLKVKYDNIIINVSHRGFKRQRQYFSAVQSLTVLIRYLRS